MQNLVRRVARLATAMVIAAGTLVAAPVAQSQTTVYSSSTGTIAPSDFGCIHHTGLEVCWPCLGGQDLYFGPDVNFNARVGAIRLYGMGGLEWGNSTEKSPGVYDWRYWDSAFAKFRRAGIKTVIYTLYNPPHFYNRYPHDYGGWRMQLPNSQAALNRWLSTITTRYPEIKVVEVANEVFAPAINNGFWIGTEAELSTLSNWVLDWRRNTGWRGKVWSPSIPGFYDNVQPFMSWLTAFPRRQEFDAIPGHFYFLTYDQLGKPTSSANAWTAFVELRDRLRAAGINKPIVDGEHGFAPGQASAAQIFNYGVKAMLEGIQQVCYFHWGSYGNDETNVGQPFRNADVKKAFEDLSALGGKRIVRVVETTPGTRWQVTTR